MRAKVTVLLALTTLVSACTTPSPETRAPRATSSVPAPAAAAAPTSAPTVAPSGSPTAEASDGLDQELIKEGYKPAQHDGVIYYCKVVQLSGARYPVNRCYTAAQIHQSEQEVKGELNHLHLPGACHGMGCS